MLYELFYKYLILNGRASMPGIGTFGVEQVPATMDFENKKLTPPTQNIKIESYEIATDTYSLYNYLAKELGVNESEAARRFQELTHDIEKQIAASGILLLPGIGKIRKEFSGYVIDAETESKQVLPDLWITKTQAANTSLMDIYANVQPSIIKQSNFQGNSEKLVAKEKEDYWWVIAIVLAIMGLGALLYYYI
jgi:hypothetical protein